MDEKKLNTLAKELAKDLKTQDDLAALSRRLVKLTVETALNAELEDHLGYPRILLRGTGVVTAVTATLPKRSKAILAKSRLKPHVIGTAPLTRCLFAKARHG